MGSLHMSQNQNDFSSRFSSQNVCFAIGPLCRKPAGHRLVVRWALGRFTRTAFYGQVRWVAWPGPALPFVEHSRKIRYYFSFVSDMSSLYTVNSFNLTQELHTAPDTRQRNLDKIVPHHLPSQIYVVQ